MLRRWFMPNSAGALLFVLMLLAQGLLAQRSMYTASQVGDGPEHERHSLVFGYPALVDVYGETGGQSMHVDVEWLMLLALLAGTWAVVMPLGRLMTDAGVARDSAIALRPRRHPVRSLTMVLAATLLIAFLGAGAASKYYWGYAYVVPGLDRRVRDATAVTSATHFYRDPDEPAGLQARAAYGAEELADLKRPYRGEYPFLSRGVRHLARRELLQMPPTTMPIDRVARVVAALDATGKLEVQSINGDVFELTSPGGEALLFVVARGNGGGAGQVSNDHYPYHEFLFAREPDGAGGAGERLNLVAFQRFYYDVAGMEGFEWPLMFTLFSAALLAVTLPATILFLAVRRLIDRRRGGLRGFQVEPLPAPAPAPSG